MWRGLVRCERKGTAARVVGVAYSRSSARAALDDVKFADLPPLARWRLDVVGGHRDEDIMADNKEAQLADRRRRPLLVEGSGGRCAARQRAEIVGSSAVQRGLVNGGLEHLLIVAAEHAE